MVSYYFVVTMGCLLGAGWIFTALLLPDCVLTFTGCASSFSALRRRGCVQFIVMLIAAGLALAAVLWMKA